MTMVMALRGEQSAYLLSDSLIISKNARGTYRKVFRYSDKVLVGSMGRAVGLQWSVELVPEVDCRGQLDRRTRASTPR